MFHVPRTDHVITAGLDGQVRIWNLLTGALVSSWPSGAGAFWDAVLIDDRAGPWLVCGCEDGAVRVWSVADSLLRAVLRRGVSAARVLALGVDRAMPQAADGVTVRVWATAVDGGVAAWSVTLRDEGAVMNSTPSHEFLLPAVEHWTTKQNRERSRRQRLRDSRVMGWRVVCYQSSERDEHKRVLIGDSAGRVTVWLVSTSTLIQTLSNPVFTQTSRKNQRTENVNNTDVLALELVEMFEADSTALPANKKRKLTDGTAVNTPHVIRQLYVSGVDSTVYSYRHDEHKDEWLYLDKRRDTAHDTQCAIVLHRDTTYSPQHINWLVLAGVDPALHLYKLEAQHSLTQSTHHAVIPHSHHPERHYALTTVNQTDQQLLLVQYKEHCQLWHVPPSATSETGPVLLLTVHITTSRGIDCSALAPNGEWLAVSADDQLKLFKLHYELDEQELLYRAEVTKVAHSFHTRGPIAQLRFVPAISEQAPRLVVGTLSQIHVLDLQRMQSLGHITREAQHSIDQLAINVLGDKLAVLDQQHQRVSIYSLTSLQVSLAGTYLSTPTHPAQLTATLPALGVVTSIKFHSNSPACLVLATQNTFWMYDLDNNNFTDWSREYAPVIAKHVTHKLKGRTEPIINLFFNDKFPNHIFLHTLSAILHFDTSLPLSKGSGWGAIKKYKSVLFCDSFLDGSLLVVELPTDNLKQNLPPHLKREHFAS